MLLKYLEMKTHVSGDGRHSDDDTDSVLEYVLSRELKMCLDTFMSLMENSNSSNASVVLCRVYISRSFVLCLPPWGRRCSPGRLRWAVWPLWRSWRRVSHTARSSQRWGAADPPADDVCGEHRCTPHLTGDARQWFWGTVSLILSSSVCLLTNIWILHQLLVAAVCFWDAMSFCKLLCTF